MERNELAAILKDVGNFSMDDFAGRLTLQKTVRLLQAFGINLGYRYTWYLHGPYCKALVRDGYIAREVVDDLPELNITFEGELVQRRYEQFKEFMEDKKHDPALLEICATMCHLAAAGIGKDAVLELTVNKKPHLDRSRCLSMWSELEKYEVVGQ